jgi:hypothetical protein
MPRGGHLFEAIPRCKGDVSDFGTVQDTHLVVALDHKILSPFMVYIWMHLPH